MTETQHKSLAEALAAFQAEAPTLYKGEEAKAGSFSYKYVDLPAVVDAIKPLMGTHGLSWSAFPCVGPDGKPALRYKLTHVSGDCESDVMPLMLSKADAQALGSAITYGRRYALCAVLNLVADADDDGAAARAAAERARSETGQAHVETAAAVLDAVEVATPADVEELRKAAHGLTNRKLKLAFSAVGLDAAQVAFEDVPRDKVVDLCLKLENTAR